MDLNDEKSVRELNIAISERNRKLFERYLLMPVLIPAFIVTVILSSQASFDYFGLLSSSHAAFLLGMGMNSMISEYFNILIFSYCICSLLFQMQYLFVCFFIKSQKLFFIFMDL